MICYAGIDVSLNETTICVVTEKGRMVPAVCLEMRHVHAAMTVQRNKTDAADALGIAHLMRTGWFRKAYMKSADSCRLRLRLTQQRNLKRKFLDLENAIPHALKVFGIRLGAVGQGGFERAVLAAVAEDPLAVRAMAAMVGRERAVQIAMQSELCRRFMAIPGVGPIIALSFATAVEDPFRFRRSRDLAAYFGLTSKRWQSGNSIDIRSRISKAGDLDVRRALYEAASAMLTRFKGTDALKTWGLKLAKTNCHPKAPNAVTRKLAVMMHAMWRNGSDYVGDPDARPEDVGAWVAAKTRRLNRATS